MDQTTPDMTNTKPSSSPTSPLPSEVDVDDGNHNNNNNDDDNDNVNLRDRDRLVEYSEKCIEEFNSKNSSPISLRRNTTSARRHPSRSVSVARVADIMTEEDKIGLNDEHDNNNNNNNNTSPTRSSTRQTPSAYPIPSHHAFSPFSKNYPSSTATPLQRNKHGVSNNNNDDNDSLNLTHSSTSNTSSFLPIWVWASIIVLFNIILFGGFVLLSQKSMISSSPMFSSSPSSSMNSNGGYFSNYITNLPAVSTDEKRASETDRRLAVEEARYYLISTGYEPFITARTAIENDSNFNSTDNNMNLMRIDHYNTIPVSRFPALEWRKVDTLLQEATSSLSLLVAKTISHGETSEGEVEDVKNVISLLNKSRNNLAGLLSMSQTHAALAEFLADSDTNVISSLRKCAHALEVEKQKQIDMNTNNNRIHQDDLQTNSEQSHIIAKITSENRKYQAEIETLSNELKANKITEQAYMTTNAECMKEVNTLQETITSVKSQVERCDHDLKSTQESLEICENKQQLSQSMIETLKQSATSIATTTNECEKMILTQQAEFATTSAEKAACEVEKQGLKLRLEENASHIAALEEKYQTEIQSLTASITSAQGAAIAAQNVEKDAAQLVLQEKIQLLQDQLNKCEMNEKSHEKALENQQAEFENCKSQINTLQDEYNNKVQEQLASTLQLRDTQREISSLNSNYVACQMDLEKATQNAQNAQNIQDACPVCETCPEPVVCPEPIVCPEPSTCPDATPTSTDSVCNEDINECVSVTNQLRGDNTQLQEQLEGSKTAHEIFFSNLVKDMKNTCTTKCQDEYDHHMEHHHDHDHDHDHDHSTMDQTRDKCVTECETNANLRISKHNEAIASLGSKEFNPVSVEVIPNDSILSTKVENLEIELRDLQYTKSQLESELENIKKQQQQVDATATNADADADAAKKQEKDAADELLRKKYTELEEQLTTSQNSWKTMQDNISEFQKDIVQVTQIVDTVQQRLETQSSQSKKNNKIDIMSFQVHDPIVDIITKISIYVTEFLHQRQLDQKLYEQQKRSRYVDDEFSDGDDEQHEDIDRDADADADEDEDIHQIDNEDDIFTANFKNSMIYIGVVIFDFLLILLIAPRSSSFLSFVVVMGWIIVATYATSCNFWISSVICFANAVISYLVVLFPSSKSDNTTPHQVSKSVAKKMIS